MTRNASKLARLATTIALGAAVTFAAAANAATPAKSKHSDIYMYQGPDREARILENARKEGSVSLYTSLNLKDSVPITEAFEKKYGVKVSLWRASSEKVVQRAVTEARGGRFTPDVFETNGPEMEALYREQLLDTFYSPTFKDLPPEAFPKHRHYVPDRFNFFVVGWNTNLVKPQDVPNSYQDLLDPKWTGRIGMEASDVDWFGAMVKYMGEDKGLEYFRKLAALKPALRTGHTLIAELVTLHNVRLHKDGDAVAGQAELTQRDLSAALPSFVGLRPVSASQNGIVVSATGTVLGKTARVPLQVLADRGRVVERPDVPLGSLASIKVFNDPRVFVESLGAELHGNRYLLTARARLK
jgi:spermidine/putrescine-binding protein